MKKKDFLSDVMLFEMLKFVIDCKDFIISTKHGYVNELPIKTVL